MLVTAKGREVLTAACPKTRQGRRGRGPGLPTRSNAPWTESTSRSSGPARSARRSRRASAATRACDRASSRRATRPVARRAHAGALAREPRAPRGSGAAGPRGRTPIASIHVSQKGGPGRTLITAREQGLPALGYTVSYADAARPSSRRASSSASASTVRYGDAVRVDRARRPRRRPCASPRGGEARRAPAGAGRRRRERRDDSGHRISREGLRPDRGHRRRARRTRPHGGRAYERFTPRGPGRAAAGGGALRAGLDRASGATRAAQSLAGDAHFLAELQAHFGDRAGRFVSVAGARASFPLKLRTINATDRAAHGDHRQRGAGPAPDRGTGAEPRACATRRRSRAAIARGIARGDRRRRRCSRPIARSRRRDAARGVAFTDLLVSARSATSAACPRGAAGSRSPRSTCLPPARRLLADRMIHGAPAP